MPHERLTDEQLAALRDVSSPYHSPERARETLTLLIDLFPALLDEIDMWRSNRVPCNTCLAPVEPIRHCYVVPVCYACLPPPPPLKVIDISDPRGDS